MKYNIFFGKFGNKKGYVVVGANKNDFSEVYDDIQPALKQIRQLDQEAMISLKFLDTDGVMA